MGTCGHEYFYFGTDRCMEVGIQKIKKKEKWLKKGKRT
jgi:hypothetical protein